jgi:hypothetical protein
MSRYVESSMRQQEAQRTIARLQSQKASLERAMTDHAQALAVAETAVARYLGGQKMALGLLAVLSAYQLSTTPALLILGGGFLWILRRYVIDKEPTLDQAAPRPETQAVQPVAVTQE